MNLTATKRAKETKGAIKQMRRKGNIPAVFYAPGKSGETIEIDGTEFEAVLRNVKQGRLSTTVFTLNLDGKPIQAIIKDIQYERTTYKVIHIDFETLSDKVAVKVKVPIECTGVEECTGIKLGGFLRQVIRTVKVKCLPRDIPAEFFIDIRDLGIRQSKRLSDIEMPKGVTPVAANEVVVVIAKR